MTTFDALVKKARSGNLVSQREPLAAPPDPYAAGCPTRLLDRMGDKRMVLTLGLTRDKPRRFNALRRDIEGVTQKMLSQTLRQMERDGLDHPGRSADDGFGRVRGHAARPDARSRSRRTAGLGGAITFGRPQRPH
jgi:hypothetical protein